MIPTITGTALNSTVTASSQQITLANSTTQPAVRYLLTSSTNCWIKLGTNPTAEAGASGNTYLPAGVPVVVLAQDGVSTKLAVIRATADGNISATPIA